MPFCHLIFFKIIFVKKFFQESHQSGQAFWTQIRPNILLGPTWVQTACKSYQQTALRDKESISAQLKYVFLNTPKW